MRLLKINLLQNSLQKKDQLEPKREYKYICDKIYCISIKWSNKIK